MQQQPMNQFGANRQPGQGVWTQGNSDGSGYAGVGGTYPQPWPQQGAPSPWQQNSGGQPQYDPGYGQGYAQAPQQGYNQPQSYAQPQQPYGQPQQTYSQPQQGAWPGQGAAGWQQQMPQQAWPEEVYQGRPARRMPRITPKLVLTILAAGVLPLLFVIALLVRAPIMTILAAGLGIGMLVTLWLTDVYERPTTLMISVLYAVAIAVAIILTITAGGKKDAANPAGTAAPSATPFGQTESSDPDGIGGMVITGNDEPVTTPLPQQADESIQVSDRFLYYWKNNNLDSMVNACSRSWTQSLSSGSDPKSKLWELLSGRKVVSYEYVSATGSINDLRRTVTYETDMIRPGASTTSKYITKIDVVHDADTGLWYVDPRSLESNTATPTPTPASTFPTQPPDPAPGDPGTVLYYNPDGGTMYHIDAYCESARKEFLPFKGHFTFAQINDPAYKDLKPCNRCGAPRRPD